MKTKMNYTFLNRPGRYLSESKLEKLVSELREVAASCLDEVPDYQCLVVDRDFFKRALIAIARDAKTSKIIGFCSTVLLDLKSNESVLHLGLTCVNPSYRGLKLTHKLTSRVIKGYFLQISPFKPLWITNVACVLSSLGNVAKHFENVYPSPFLIGPSSKHILIAKDVAKNYRSDFFVEESVHFNDENFVFEASVAGNSFEKSASDTKFYHREDKLNQYYKSILDFNRGDEVLQVGYVSIFSVFKFMFKKLKKKYLVSKPLFEIESDGISIK